MITKIFENNKIKTMETKKQIEEVLNELETKYKMLISDWIPVDGGRMKEK